MIIVNNEPSKVRYASYRLLPGDNVRIQSPYRPPYIGIVETFVPELGIAWVRDAVSGERRLLHEDEDTLMELSRH